MRAFNLIQSYTNLIFSPSFDDRVTTVLRLANAFGVADAGAEGQAPTPGTVDAGDIFFAPSVRNADGQQLNLAILHEIGHALGLTTGDHVFDRFGDMEPLSSHGPVRPDHDTFEYSVMNNPSFRRRDSRNRRRRLITAELHDATTSPRCNKSTAPTSTMFCVSLTYSWDPSTGEEFINSVRPRPSRVETRSSRQFGPQARFPHSTSATSPAMALTST